MIRNAEDSRKLREQAKKVLTTFKSTQLSAEEPVIVFDFLTRLVKRTRTLGVYEARSFLSLSKLLPGPAEIHLQSIQNGAHFDLVICCPKVVNLFLCTYSTPAATYNAVNNLQNICRMPRQNKLENCKPINGAAQRCRNVYDKVDKMTFIVNGLSSSIQTVIARFPESETQRKLSCKDLFCSSQDKTNSRWARLQQFSEVPNATERKKDNPNPVFCVESTRFDQDILYREDHPYFIVEDPRSIDSNLIATNYTCCFTFTNTAEDNRSW